MSEPSDGAAEAASDAGADASQDAGVADAADDAAGDASLPPSACGDGGGCRTFSSYCSDKLLEPCTCYALGASDPDPTCNGQQVTCLNDPCAGKTAVCGDAGVCALSN